MRIKTISVFISVGILASLTSSYPAFAMQTVFPTGTTIYKPDEAYSTSVIPYDFTPQLRELPKPEELAVTPPNNLEWRLKPDKFRKKDES